MNVRDVHACTYTCIYSLRTVAILCVYFSDIGNGSELLDVHHESKGNCIIIVLGLFDIPCFHPGYDFIFVSTYYDFMLSLVYLLHCDC